MFKIGDWVQITPYADLKWHVWKNSKDIYNEFAGKIGVLEKIDTDDDRPGQNLFCIKVDFPYGLAGLSPGKYHEWFRPEHLIRSSKYNKELKDHREQATKDLQEWEAFKIKSTNDALRKVFSNESPKVIEIPKQTQIAKEETEYEHLWGIDPTWNYDDLDYVSCYFAYNPPLDERIENKHYECISNNTNNNKIYSFSNINDVKKSNE
jgi:hypothetical protein